MEYKFALQHNFDPQILNNNVEVDNKNNYFSSCEHKHYKSTNPFQLIQSRSYC